MSFLPQAGQNAKVRPSPPKTVALLVETSRAYGRGICQGIAKYAQENPLWEILYQERNLKQSVPKFIKRREVDGILMRVDQPRVAKEILSLAIPTVDLLHLPDQALSSAFLIDDAAVAILAADYFLNNGFVHFAFCGYQGISFSDRRSNVFVEHLKPHHFSVNCYESRRPLNHRREVLRAEDLGFHEIESLGRWLVRLPQPVGLFACNDVRALQVLQACKQARLSVPDQVAVLGVDNDEIITQLSHPKLSSIEPDTILTGYKACLCLDKLMHGERERAQIDYTPPLGVIERESTNFIATTDKLVAEALRRIRGEAFTGLTVKALLDRLAVCRTNLESRFKKVLGRTVHREITRIRLKRVCQLLHMGDLTLAAIAQQTGYLEVSHMSRSFRKHFGVWPGQYRTRSRTG